MLIYATLHGCIISSDHVRRRKNEERCARLRRSLLPTPVPCIIARRLKWSENPWERVCYRWWTKTSQLMNLTPFRWKDKIFVFFMCYTVFCASSNDAWLFQLFLKREGVQAHNARLIVNPASHTVNSSTYKLMCDCMIFYILFALLFNFLKHMRCERMEVDGSARNAGAEWFSFHCWWCWLNKLQRLIPMLLMMVKE